MNQSEWTEDIVAAKARFRDEWERAMRGHPGSKRPMRPAAIKARRKRERQGRRRGRRTGGD